VYDIIEREAIGYENFTLIRKLYLSASSLLTAMDTADIDKIVMSV
jgi:hypothetical protein